MNNKNSAGYQENLYTPGCMRTYSGIYVNILNPTQDMFVIEDIAHALSQIPRFGGHLPRFYSVAEHCLACVNQAVYDKRSKEDIFACLMHDASEAYLGDCISSIKNLNPQYKKLERYYMIILSNKFKFNMPDDYVKLVDRNILESEWLKFFEHNNGYVFTGDREGNVNCESKDDFLYCYNLYKP